MCFLWMGILINRFKWNYEINRERKSKLQIAINIHFVKKISPNNGRFRSKVLPTQREVNVRLGIMAWNHIMHLIKVLWIFIHSFVRSLVRCSAGCLVWFGVYCFFPFLIRLFSILFSLIILMWHKYASNISYTLWSHTHLSNSYLSMPGSKPFRFAFPHK